MKTLAAIVAAIATASVLLISSMTSAQSQPAQSAANWSFGGRPVIVEKAGVHFGVSEHAKLEPSKESPLFVVIRINPNSPEAYDYWQPLSDISNIKVFDTMEAAKSYNEKHRPGK